MRQLRDTRVEIIEGSITELDVEAIVNAASHLLGGGGVAERPAPLGAARREA